MRAFSKLSWKLLYIESAGGARPAVGLDGEEEIGQSLRVWCWEGGIDFWKGKSRWGGRDGYLRQGYDGLISWLGNGATHDFGVRLWGRDNIREKYAESNMIKESRRNHTI